MGQQLLQVLLCHMVQTLDKESVEKRWVMLFPSPTPKRRVLPETSFHIYITGLNAVKQPVWSHFLFLSKLTVQ